MQHAVTMVLALLVELVGLLVTAIAVIEHGARGALSRTGVTGPPQTVILILLAIALVIAAFRLFGRVFAMLIGLVLVLILLHALMVGQGMANV